MKTETITFKNTDKHLSAGYEIYQVFTAYKKSEPVYIGGIVFNSANDKERRYIFVPRNEAVYFTEYGLRQIAKKIKEQSQLVNPNHKEKK